MSVEYRLPDLGEGLHEAEVVKWLVEEGATVRQDQGVLEVETDKAITEVPAPVAGVLRGQAAKPGDTVHVGDVLFFVEQAGEAPAAAPVSTPAAPAPVASAAAPSSSVAAAPATPAAEPASGAGVRATPAVRKLARDLDVNIELVRGTGPDGRILAADVQLAASGGQAAPAAPAATEAPAAVALAQAQVGTAPAPPVFRRVVSGEPMPDEEVVPLTGIRKRVAEAMVEAKRTIPHITGMDELDATKLMATREALKPRAEAVGVKLTYLPFIIKAVVVALRKYPMMRASANMEQKTITIKHRYNIGIATATDDGLIVPVLHDADRKTILEIAVEVQQLAEKARTRRVPLESLQGGAFTITNFGSLGSWHGIPIIRPGESGILGVGSIRQKAVVIDGQIVARPMMAIDLGADHRLVDGDVMAGFLKEVMFMLEEPAGLLLEMV